MPGGSIKKKCPFCEAILFCAQKKCTYCKMEQPAKQRLKKRLKKFDQKREEWVVGLKKNHNLASIKDEAIVLLEKLHAMGYKPVLLLGKETKTGATNCEVLTPRCELTLQAQNSLQKMGSFYESICEGWSQEIPADDDQVITLTLTPCDPLEVKSQEQASSTEGQAYSSDLIRAHAERALSLSPVQNAEEVENPKDLQTAEEVENPKDLQAAEVQSRGSDIGTVLNPRRKKKTSEAPKHLPVRKKTQINCSYHSRLEAFPIRRVVKERLRNGKEEILVDWKPCPVCGKEWAHSWQPKNFLQ
ncbi:uncharacterized protein LOC127360331 isoform X2 [Dicentrarchus labrax]|uniref:uncharacterized protein LOC127360331 isoform X2 n=1 Tax=Dicentrarchus labrax TaxID=13489 RepID=UPI0021F571F1|nr:uncharacterized protein LOC127360331 isoform X2 [Dicentrarchus labrax]